MADNTDQKTEAQLEDRLAEQVVMQAKFPLSGEIGWGDNLGYYLRNPLPVLVTKYADGNYICALYFKKEKEKQKFFHSFSTSYGDGSSLIEAKTALKDFFVCLADDCFRSRSRQMLEEKVKCAEIFLLIPMFSGSSSYVSGSLECSLALIEPVPVQIYRLLDRKYVDGKKVDKKTYRCHGYIGNSYHCNALLIGAGQSEELAKQDFKKKLANLAGCYLSLRQYTRAAEGAMVTLENLSFNFSEDTSFYRALDDVSEDPFSKNEKYALARSVAEHLFGIIALNGTPLPDLSYVRRNKNNFPKVL